MILSHHACHDDENRRTALLLANDLLRHIPTDVLLELLLELTELATIPESPNPAVNYAAVNYATVN